MSSGAALGKLAKHILSWHVLFFFDAGIPHDVGAWHLSNSYVISVALWVVLYPFVLLWFVR